MEEQQTKRKVRPKSPFSVAPVFEPMVVLHGEREAVVYGCRKILLYTAEEIRFSVRKRRLCVLGENLTCSSFSGGTVTVEGNISSIRYEGIEEGERLR